jgi:hypothetical protein
MAWCLVKHRDNFTFTCHHTFQDPISSGATDVPFSQVCMSAKMGYKLPRSEVVELREVRSDFDENLSPVAKVNLLCA